MNARNDKLKGTNSPWQILSRRHWPQNKAISDQHNSFCTCSPSGNQVDGLPLAPRLFGSSVHVWNSTCAFKFWCYLNNSHIISTIHMLSNNSHVISTQAFLQSLQTSGLAYEASLRGESSGDPSTLFCSGQFVPLAASVLSSVYRRLVYIYIYII
jgi:hypothetical protein